MLPEQQFLRFAFPCTWLLKEAGRVGKEEFGMLKKAAEQNIPADRGLLEKTYKTAINHMRDIAKRMKKDLWDNDVITHYFLKEHDKAVDMSGLLKTPSMKKLCRILEGKVVDIKDDILIVDVDGERRAVSSALVPDVKTGDKVLVHYGYCVEKRVYK